MSVSHTLMVANYKQHFRSYFMVQHGWLNEKILHLDI